MEWYLVWRCKGFGVSLGVLGEVCLEAREGHRMARYIE